MNKQIKNVFVMILCIVPLIANIPIVERDALVALYNQTDGNNWDSKTNWTIDDPCTNSWSGITCNDINTTITKISLTKNQLSGAIPSELGNLVHLLGLFLEENNLSEPIPTELGDLTHLTHLVLNNNQLSGTLPPPCSFKFT